jgi:hypothetical protein
MQNKYSKQHLSKKPVGGSKLTLHYLLNGKTVCAADYRLTADERFIEIPFPVSRLLSA